nr:alpha-L-fucosidase 1-like [Tanacetum cinerariifolium]
QSPRKLSDLLKIYYNSVGRNCVLLLNVPPNTTGLISANDIQRLKEFKSALDTIFTKNLAQTCSVKASSVRGGKGSGFGPESVIWKHEIYVDGKRVATGTTVGYKKLHRLEDGVVTGRSVRIRVIGSRGIPLISSVGLHYDPFWRPTAR